MSEQFVIHNLAFAEGKQRLEGRVPLQQLPRLAASLARADGEVRFVVQGGVNALRLPVLDISVETDVCQVCQRCLQPFTHAVSSQNRLVVVKTQEQVEEYDSDDEDAVLVEAAFDVLTWVEDEVLLNLSFAPRHEQCVDIAAAAGAVAEKEKPNPFAVLAKLKTRH